MIKTILLISSGAVIGALLRYALSKSCAALGIADWSVTLTNILGSFLIGFILVWFYRQVHEHQAISEMASKDFILFLTTGLLSSFTTFSAMVFELVESLQQGQWWFALSRIGIQLVLGIVAVVLGSGLANRLP